MTGWYAVMAIGRQEASVARSLAAAGIDVFLPTTRQRRLWSDRIRTQEMALFPGYLFVQVDLGPREVLRIQKVRGVLGIVGLRGGEAPAVALDVINALQALVSAQRALSVVETLPPGTEVVIGRGALAGVRGRVCGRNHDTLAVEVALLGRVVTCSLAAEDLVAEQGVMALQPSV